MGGEINKSHSQDQAAVHAAKFRDANKAAKQNSKQKVAKSERDGLAGTLRNTANRNNGTDNSQSYMGRGSLDSQASTKKTQSTTKPPPAYDPVRQTYSTSSTSTSRTMTPRSSTQSRASYPLQYRGQTVMVDPIQYGKDVASYKNEAYRINYSLLYDELTVEGATNAAGEVEVDPRFEQIANALAHDAAGKFAILKQQLENGQITQEQFNQERKIILDEMKMKLKRRKRQLMESEHSRTTQEKMRRQGDNSLSKNSVNMEDKYHLEANAYENVKIVET